MIVYFIHGINTTRRDYTAPLIGMLPTRVDPVPLFWGDKVRPWVESFQNRARPITPRWWDFRRRIKRWLIKAGHESAIWVSAYHDRNIRRDVLESLSTQIIRSRQTREAYRVSFVAHSLGSLALIHLLNKMLDEGKLDPDSIHSIITMGSPVAFWGSQERLPGLIDRIPTVAGWVNVRDLDDPIAAPLGGYSDRIQDVVINTGWTARSHVNYWRSKAVAQVVQGRL